MKRVDDRSHERWCAAGAELRRLNSTEFQRIFALVEAFVSIEQPDLERRELFDARLADISGRRGSA